MSSTNYDNCVAVAASLLTTCEETAVPVSPYSLIVTCNNVLLTDQQGLVARMYYFGGVERFAL
jgi:hypothetical protein